MTHLIQTKESGEIPPPYSLSIQDAARHFGFKPQTLYDWISTGKLLRGIHYLKVGKKVVIVRHQFIRYMEDLDGTQNN